MKAVRHSSVYEALAIKAGEDAGLPYLIPEELAKDPAAVSLRDVAWEEYELLLRDTNTYTIDAIVKRLAENGIKASRSAVHRDRRALTQRERAIILSSQKAKAVLEMAGSNGDVNIFSGAQTLAGQIIFEALGNLDAASLDGMKPGQILQMISTLSYLSKTRVESKLIEAKTAELQKKFDAEFAKLTKAANGKREINADDVKRIREKVFGAA